MRKVFLPQYLNWIYLVGVGGTGSYLAQGLAKLLSGYRMDIRVILYDPDVVEEKNCSRQNFWHYEIGQNKAQALALRLNQQYGLSFGAFAGTLENFGKRDHELLITCTDTVSSRKPFADCNYWLDMGNAMTAGQAIFGTTSNKDLLAKELNSLDVKPIVENLPSPYLVGNMKTLKDEPKEASCADHPFAEQSVFVNEWAAQAGLAILHQLLVQRQVKTPHIYFDAATGRMNPIYITKEIYQ